MAEMKRIAVIGGGASGLMAAYAAAKNGALVSFTRRTRNSERKYISREKGVAI